MFNKNQDKDERAIFVEKSSFTFAFKIITYAILLDVITGQSFSNKHPGIC